MVWPELVTSTVEPELVISTDEVLSLQWTRTQGDQLIFTISAAARSRAVSLLFRHAVFDHVQDLARSRRHAREPWSLWRRCLPHAFIVHPARHHMAALDAECVMLAARRGRNHH